MSSEDLFMRIGRLAQASGVSARSLRHYEKRGLLTPRRRENGYRDYSEAALLQIKRIQWLLSAGLTTKAIRRMLPCVLEEGPAVIECPTLRRDLEKEVARLEERIEALKQSRNLLQRALGGSRAR
ncbi:MAG TPA: MerR family transcriptional regulator [Bryobacteraceae bacterium]